MALPAPTPTKYSAIPVNLTPEDKYSPVPKTPERTYYTVPKTTQKPKYSVVPNPQTTTLKPQFNHRSPKVISSNKTPTTISEATLKNLTDDEINTAFKTFDVNNDGWISRDEFSAIMKILGKQNGSIFA